MPTPQGSDHNSRPPQTRNRPASWSTGGQKKKLTRAQKRRRHNIIRYSIFAGFGIALILVLVLLISLISLIVRHVGGHSSDAASAASAISELSAASAFSSSELIGEQTSPEPEIEPTSVTLMAVGDNLIHNTVYEYAQVDAEGSDYDFTEIYRYVLDDIQEADIACIQQETILIDDPSQYSNYPTFGTPVQMADSLATVGFDVICHASNHTWDKGITGITDSLARWRTHPEITVLGIHDTEEDADTIRVVEKNNIRIAMLDYTYGMNGFIADEDWQVDLLDEDHKDHIAAQIAEAKELSDIVVVFMHTGTEGQFDPDDSQLSWAQFFADEGVGLVIGTHPHVIGPTDVLTGESGNTMPVFYSLGNFVSSQTDTQNLVGAMAKVTISKDSSGTYVSQYSVEPVCTLISAEGTYGYGYAFHIYHLEDYTDELAAKHLRSSCYPDDFWSVWNSVFEDDAAWTPAAADTTDTADTADTTDTADTADTMDIAA